MKSIVLGLAAMLAVSTAYAAEPAKVMDTSLGKVWTDDKGMTLYTFDKDTKGAKVSACTGECIVNWPPFLAAEGATAEGDWTLGEVTDKDGAKNIMWAFKGWLLYLWVKDTKPGEVTGDGVNNVWHIAAP